MPSSELFSETARYTCKIERRFISGWVVPDKWFAVENATASHTILGGNDRLDFWLGEAWSRGAHSQWLTAGVADHASHLVISFNNVLTVSHYLDGRIVSGLAVGFGDW